MVVDEDNTYMQDSKIYRLRKDINKTRWYLTKPYDSSPVTLLCTYEQMDGWLKRDFKKWNGEKC